MTMEWECKGIKMSEKEKNDEFHKRLNELKDI